MAGRFAVEKARSVSDMRMATVAYAVMVQRLEDALGTHQRLV